jgi:hypothetical protein
MTNIKILAALAAIAFSAPALAVEYPDPASVNVGRPDDIPQDVFAIVRKTCAERYKVDFDIREYCERQNFKAIRSLRGQGPDATRRSQD